MLNDDCMVLDVVHNKNDCDRDSNPANPYRFLLPDGMARSFPSFDNQGMAYILYGGAQIYCDDSQ